MSILIKGMDMPISCEKCPFCYDYLHCSIDDSLHMYLYNRHPNCPLIEIPTPHGRLIDANKLEAMMYHEAFETDSDMQKWDSGCWIRYKVFENCMNRLLPDTILEAEE